MAPGAADLLVHKRKSISYGVAKSQSYGCRSMIRFMTAESNISRLEAGRANLSMYCERAMFRLITARCYSSTATDLFTIINNHVAWDTVELFSHPTHTTSTNRNHRRNSAVRTIVSMYVLFAVAACEPQYLELFGFLRLCMARIVGCSLCCRWWSFRPNDPHRTPDCNRPMQCMSANLIF